MLIRDIPTEEFKAILKGKIPVFDAVFDFDIYGKAIFVRKQKYGVINRSYNILLDNMYDEMKFLKNGCIIAKYENAYLLFDKIGYLIRPKGFETEEAAISYSKFF